MLTCTNCGASVREGARFCTSCGTRLNDPVSPVATGVWASPVTSDPVSSGTRETEADRVPNDSSVSVAGGRTDPETNSNMDPETAPDVRMESAMAPAAEPAPSTDEGFTWSWGTAASPERDDAPDTARQVDEESGVVLEEAGSDDAEPDDGELVDATEIDIREPDGTDAVIDERDEPAPETSDAMLVVEEEIASEQGESETLAAWAGQWDSQGAEGEIAGNDEPSETIPEEPDVPDEQVAASAGAANEPAPDNGEDTVARAERLIGELRSIIPTLARPMPAPAASLPDPSPLADELEGAARAGQFDDLRETLQLARERPRDVDTMLSLSAKVDRLLELLDDRDNLARTAESAATRLRPTSNASEM